MKPPRQPRTKHRLWPLLPPIVVIGLTVFFLSLTHWLGRHGIECGIRKFTGFYCPGCGGTRCATALTHGNILQAWSHNALLTTGVGLFVITSLYLIVRITLWGKPPPKIIIHPRWFWLALAGVALFAVLRNTQTFFWLAP